MARWVVHSLSTCNMTLRRWSGRLSISLIHGSNCITPVNNPTHTWTYTEATSPTKHMQIRTRALGEGTCMQISAHALAGSHHPTAHLYSPCCPVLSRLVVWKVEEGWICLLYLLSLSGSKPTGSNTTSLPLTCLSRAWLILPGTMESRRMRQWNCNPLQIWHQAGVTLEGMDSHGFDGWAWIWQKHYEIIRLLFKGSFETKTSRAGKFSEYFACKEVKTKA